VKWWDNTTTVYDSGDPFSKAAAGNQRAFELYPCNAGGVASGQFDGFDISNNALTRVRSEDLTLADGVAPGYATTYPYAYVPASPAESAILSGNLLSAAALDEFYTDLDSGGGDIFVSGNPGIDADDPTIATAKGYTVFGSVPPGTALLLNFNGSNGSTTFTDSSPNGLTVTAGGDAEISTAQNKFGGASGLFGIGDYLVVLKEAAEFGEGEFTIEMWTYVSATQTSDFPCVFSNYSTFGQNALALFATTAPTADDKWILTYDGVFPGIESTNDIPYDEWAHVAVVRSGNTLTLYVNGVSEGSADVSGRNLTGNANDWYVNGAGDELGSNNCIGYIDDLRVVKGLAVYTANFTPPAAQLGVYP